MRAILINPTLRSIQELDIKGGVEEIRSLIGCEGLDSFRLADFEGSYDYGWIDDTGLSREQPIDAFKFDIRHDPLGGNCLIIGTTKDWGLACGASIPLDFLHQHISWLGTIRPEVTTVQDGPVTRLVVTYSRVAS